MSNSSEKDYGEVAVHSKFGPIRIELLDDRLNRHALGFGELRKHVPAGLYTLQYRAGMKLKEEILRVKPGRTVTREVAMLFPAVAPISVSTTHHEFHSERAQEFSQQLKQGYGADGGLMIFVRTIDGDGTVPVPVDRLSLWNAEMQLVSNLAADAKRSDKQEGWACLVVKVNPGGYALRWGTPETSQSSKRGSSEAKPIDQSLWVSAGWLTIVFIGYRSESGQLERQSASIHMTRLGVGFQPGPRDFMIRDNRTTEFELKEARVNQTLDLALGGLRTGDQVVPNDLLDLLLGSKCQNPMLGIVGAYAMLQRRTREWKMFDLVVQHLEKLIPGHPDVTALRFCSELLRKQESDVVVAPLSWPPMLYTGYKGLIGKDWEKSGNLIVDESVAERAAVMLLPESPWTSWLALEATAPQPRTKPKISLSDLSRYIQQATDPATASGGMIRRLASAKTPIITFFERVSDAPEEVVKRISRHITQLKEIDEEVDLSSLSLDDFRQLGLPITTVEKAIQVLMNASKTAAV